MDTTITLPIEEQQIVADIAREKGLSCIDCRSPNLVPHSEAHPMMGLRVDLRCGDDETHRVPPLTLTREEVVERLPNLDLGQNLPDLTEADGTGRPPIA